MDEEQKKWSEQYGRNFGAKELLRFGCAFMTFLIIGITLGILFKNAGIMIIFVVLFLGIMWLAPYWQPAYSIVHKIMGNREILPTLPKYQWKWWHYIPILIKVILLLAVLRFGLQLLFQ
jgi:hypothetical protein